jgi:hypothetical protein
LALLMARTVVHLLMNTICHNTYITLAQALKISSMFLRC